MKAQFTAILICMISLQCFAAGKSAKTITDSITHTYRCSEGNVTPNQAKLTAIERAKAAMLERHFGTNVSQSSTSLLKDENGRTSTSFFAIGQTEVAGEWIRTIGEPVFEPLRYDGDILVVTVHIKGEIREINRPMTQIAVQTLRGGITDENESGEFKNGDNFFISCTSPVNGYIAVYIFPFGENVQRLLPYDSVSGCAKVRGGVREVLFENGVNPQTNSALSRYICFCDQPSQFNRIYVLFSTNPFVHPADSKREAKEGIEFPNSLSFDSFQTWLSKVRNQDTEMVVITKDILIKK